MDRWMAAFPNHMNIDGEDDVIYEDWGEDYSNATAMCVCVVCFLPLCVFLFFLFQTVLRCSVWSSTLPSRQTSSPWSPLRSSTSSAKPSVRTWRKAGSFLDRDDNTQHNIEVVMRILCFDKILHTLYANSHTHHSTHTLSGWVHDKCVFVLLTYAFV